MAGLIRVGVVVSGGTGLVGGMPAASPAVTGETVKCADVRVNSGEFTLPAEKPPTTMRGEVRTRMSGRKARTAVSFVGV
ncbi:hypothetical protein GCM10010357_10640 [Streptomyces luteireticuli]|uniref:Uncharacterized protein n=1 Tax=Streptomyces luteireticuli TaxID=173858 RepID=A0ABP3I5T1_9ACTN